MEAIDHGVRELQELTGSTSTSREELIAAYRALYERGWRASKRFDGNSDPSPLERADDRHEANAWYHGYEDDAVGNEKWSTPRGNGLF